MDISQFQSNSIVTNLVIFIGSAVLVWSGGTRLARYGKTISERTGIGQAFVGTVLLGIIVSLPEMVMAIAALASSAALAVNILLGGVAMTMVVMAVTDAAVGDEPISTDVRKPIVLLQGSLVVLLLALTAAGIVVQDRLVPVVGAGIWSTSIAVLYVVFLVCVRRLERKEPWKPTEVPQTSTAPPAATGELRPQPTSLAIRGAIWRTIAATIIVVAAGVVAARTADALAAQTKLGVKFVGFVLGGFVTSLPELSSTISAGRLRQYEMAFGDAFGTNQFSLALLFLVDLIHRGQPVLNEVGQFTVFATLLGIALTTIYLAGLVIRAKRSRLRMGIDSIAVLLTSAAGFVLLYRLR